MRVKIRHLPLRVLLPNHLPRRLRDKPDLRPPTANTRIDRAKEQHFCFCQNCLKRSKRPCERAWLRAVLYNPFVRPIANALGSSCLNSVRAYLFPTLWLAICALASGCSSGSHGADVMAKVNGHPISRAEVEKYYENQSAGAPQKPAGEQEESLRLNILKQLIDQEIMMQRAEKLNLVATDDEVDRKLNEL